jgi:hypothetical protein
MGVFRQVAADYTDEPCVAPFGLGRSWSFTKRGKATSVTVNGRLVVTFNEVELLAVFAARKAAKPSARVFVDLLASSTVMIFPSELQWRSEFPAGPAGMALIEPRVPP